MLTGSLLLRWKRVTMLKVHLSDMSVTIYQLTQRDVSEDWFFSVTIDVWENGG